MPKNTRFEGWIVMGVFLLSFGIFWKTLCPTVYLGDSGELVAVAYSLGIGHPTGYPIYYLIGKLFTFLPWGDVAYRVNLMSAFFASGAVALLYLILRQLKTAKLAAVASALLFSFSLTFWSQAVVAEVYTLNAFFVALVTLFLLLWRDGKEPRWLFAAAFTFGLGLTHHHLLLTMLPAMVWLVLSEDLALLKRKKDLLKLLALLLLGLSFYLYIPIRMIANPLINWQHVSTLKDIWFHIKGGQYEALMAPFTPWELASNFIRYLKLLSSQFTPFPLILALFGVVGLYKRDNKLFFFLLLAAAGNILAAISYNIGDIEVYYIPSYFIIAIFIGYALQLLLAASQGRRYQLLSLFIVILPLFPLVANFSVNDRSRYYLARDLATNLLKGLDKDAIMIPYGDSTVFPITYLKVVENFRPDVAIFDTSGNLLFPSATEKFPLKDPKDRKELLAMERQLVTKSKHSVYYTYKVNINSFPGVGLQQDGITFKIVRNMKTSQKQKVSASPLPLFRGIDEPNIYNDNSAKEILIYYYLIALDHPQIVGDKAMQDKIWAKIELMGKNSSYVLGVLGANYYNHKNFEKAFACLEEAVRLDPYSYVVNYQIGGLLFEKKRFKEAIAAYHKSFRFKHNAEGSYYSLGISYFNIGEIDQARQSFQKAISINPDYVEAYHGLIKTYQEKELYDDIIKTCEKVLLINNQDIVVKKILDAVKKNKPALLKGTATLAAAKFPAVDRVDRGWPDKPAREFKELRQIIKAFPTNAAAHKTLGDLYAAGDENWFAEQEYLRALQLKPDSPDVLRSLGLLYQKQGRYKLALLAYQKTLEINPNYDADHLEFNQGLIFGEQGRHEAAIAKFSRIVKRNPFYFPAMQNLGTAYYLLGRYQAAKGMFEKLIQLEPEGIETRKKLGAAYFATGAYSKAIGEFEQVLRQRPDDIEIQAQLAISYFGNKEFLKTEKAARLLLKKDPSCPIAKDLLLRLPRQSK